jgi:ATP-dependent Clp protease ATP-binding subunit ClpA
VYGARPLKRWVEKHIVTTISKMMVSEEAGEGQRSPSMLLMTGRV